MSKLKISLRQVLCLALAGFFLLAAPRVGRAVFQDDPTDADGDGFTNGEEQLMGTNPNVFDQNLGDIALLTLLQKRAFDYFWLESKPPNYFAPDRGNFNQVGLGSNAKSIAATGFSLTSMAIADNNGWVDHVEAYNRVKAILSRLRQMQQSTDDRLNKHGFFYHFIDSDGFRFTQEGFNSELSSIDHAVLMAGVMLVGQYYKGTEVEVLAKELYENTDWPFMFDGQFFYQGWLPNGGPVEGGTYYTDRWNRYSELMILLLEGIGSPTHSVTAQTWNDFDRGTVSYKAFPPYVHCGALFAHQFSHVWVDFRSKRDGKGINYFDNSKIATLVNRQFCIDLNAGDPGRYETYGPNSWGLSSADSSVGYMVLQPDFSNPAMVEYNTDSGTVVPDAAVSSMPFTPFESIQAAQNWFTNFRSSTFGRYGFRNAFNFGRPNNPNAFSHFPSGKVGLDCGTVATMVENFRTGLIWKFFGRNTPIQNAMNRVGFVNDATPFQINFDNQPAPGQDPNGFGGFSGGFGPGGISSYVSIGAVNPYVGGFVWKIKGSGFDAGAFNTLNGQDISRYDTLSFWIKGNVGGEQIRVGIKDTSGTEFTVPLSDYIQGGSVTTDFKGVRIPLRAFADHKVRLTTMDNISFRFASSQGGEILVDDIAFLPDEFKPAAPLNIQGSVVGVDVNLTWNRNTEPDVVGYNIYRSSTANGPFTKLNSLLVVDGSFKDSGALADPNSIFHYRVTAVDNALVPNESPMSSEIVFPDLAPKLDPIGDRAVIQGNLLAFTVSATDPNNDPLTFSASNLPVGASFDPATRIFSWTPAASQVGLFKGVRFNVTDGRFTDSQDITIAVSDNEIGTIDITIQDIATDRPVTGGIAFGAIGPKAGLVSSGQLIKLSALSVLNNWKVQIYTDNTNNTMTTTLKRKTRIKGGVSSQRLITTLNRFAGIGSARGLIGQKDPHYQVPLKWMVLSDKIIPSSQSSAQQVQWGTVPDRRDENFGTALADRQILDAGGMLGNFPSQGRTITGPSVYVYLAADFTGVPAQSYSTSQLTLELFKQ